MADDPRKGSSSISGGLLGAAAALATVVAAIVGTLNQLGYIGNHEATRATEISAPAPPSEEPAFAPGSAVSNEARSGAGSPGSTSQLASIKPGKHPTLTGAWRDMVGGCHLITQNGSKLEVTNYFPGSDAVMSHGEGTVEGTHILLQLRTMHGDYQVSPDGRILNGTMYRSYGPNPSVWKYIGTSCHK